MNREEIKLKARELRDKNLTSFWGTYLIIVAISFLIELAISLLFEEGSLLGSACIILSSLFNATLSVGFSGYVLKIVRGEEFERNDIFKYVSAILPITVISLLTFILCFLWSILFIIPGIIAALSYVMVYLVYIDNPELSPYECLCKSKELMQGYKWDYFVFMLSFIGWILLCVFIIPFIWVLPYVTIAEVIYYDELKKLKEKENKK